MSKPLWKRCALHAAHAPAFVLGGAVASLLATLLWNPLPLLLWVLAGAAWLLHASTSVAYAKRVLADEARDREALARDARADRAEALALQLQQPPFFTLVRRGALPDYGVRYRELEALAARIRQSAAARPELALEWTMDLEQELGRLLASYLDLAHARLAQLERLGGLSEDGAPARLRLAETEAEILRLRKLAELEPAAAEIRRSHVEVLEKRKGQLAACAAQDARLAAQLDALPDVFRFLLERVSASELDSGAIREYLGGVAAQSEGLQVPEPAPAAARHPQPVH